MNQYIITEEQLKIILERRGAIYISCQGKFRDEIVAEVRSHPYNPQAEQKPDLSHITPERRGCLTCLAPDCPVWQAADQNCWKPQTYNPQAEREKVLDEYNDELLTKLVQELAGTWRMRDAKLFSIIRKYRRVPIGAMKAELRQEGKEGE